MNDSALDPIVVRRNLSGGVGVSGRDGSLAD
jgi:hypothetical protein